MAFQIVQLFQNRVAYKLSLFHNVIKGNSSSVPASKPMHLHDLIPRLVHAEFRCIELTSIHQFELLAINRIIVPGIHSLQSKVFSVTKLPGSLIQLGLRLRTDRTMLMLHHFGKFADVEHSVSDKCVIIVDILALCRELPVRELNFNGTAGVWRKQAIYGGGGWEGDTLTEDMDLSYRSQLAGWKMKFVFDVIVPAELPNDINAFKAQQFRWAKGSIQTAIKILPRVLKAKVPLRVKIGAILHTTHYSIHPCMLFTALCAWPLLAFFEPVAHLPGWAYTIGFSFIFLAAIAPSVLYFVAQRCSGYTGWKIRLLSLPILMALGVGIAVSNSRAVFSAIIGSKGSFVRTPKSGGSKKKAKSHYAQKFPWQAVIELGVGVYCIFGLLEYIGAQKFIIGPFLALYAVGFLSVSVLSFMHYIGNIIEMHRAKKNSES